MDEKIDESEVRSVICYLDPGEQEKDKEANTATIIAVLGLLLIVAVVWFLVWLKVRQP